MCVSERGGGGHERGGSGLNSNLSVCYVHSGGMKSVERQNSVPQQLLSISGKKKDVSVSFATFFHLYTPSFSL